MAIKRLYFNNEFEINCKTFAHLYYHKNIILNGKAFFLHISIINNYFL